MENPSYTFTDMQGAFLVALKNGTYLAGERTRSFPPSSSLKSKMPPVYQQSMRGTCVANAATALVEYYEDCKTRLSVQFLHEMTKSVERDWVDRNLCSLSKGEPVDAEFGSRFPNQVAQIRLTSSSNGAESPAAQAFLNAFARQIKSHFGVQSGSSIRHCFEAIREHGVCRYSLWPYANVQAEEYSTCASFPPGSREDAQKHRILTGLYILRSPNNVDEIRGILAGANARRPMPVCVGLALFEGCDGETFRFPDVVESEGRYVSSNAMKGVHEMLVVGYEDDVKAPGGGWFTVRNSWGADWGRNGYGRVPYAYVECFCSEAGTILQDMVDYAGDGYGGIAGSTHAERGCGGRYRLPLVAAGAAVLCAAAMGIWLYPGRVGAGRDGGGESEVSAEVACGEKGQMEKKARCDEEARLAAEKAEAESKARREEENRRLAEEQAARERAKRLADEKAAREAAERRLAEERLIAEEKRLSEEKAKREEEQKRIEAEKKAVEREKARLAEERRQAEEKARRDAEARLVAEKSEAERKAKFAEERIRRLEEEKAAREAEEKRLAEKRRLAAEEAERQRRAAEEASKPVDYVFHMTVSCGSEDERTALLNAMARGTQGVGFRLSDIRSEGKASMWGGSRLSVRCDMTISAPRNRRPNARKLLSEFLMKECRTEEPVDWSHASRIMSVQDFSATATGAGDEKKSHGVVRFGF